MSADVQKFPNVSTNPATSHDFYYSHYVCKCYYHHFIIFVNVINVLLISDATHLRNKIRYEIESSL